MQSRTLGFATAAALALMPGLTGCAAPGQPREDVQPEDREDHDRELRRLPALRALDSDEDGDISAGEIDAASESLASLDDNGDGRLSGDELRPRGGLRIIGGPADSPEAIGALGQIPEGTRIITLDATDGDSALDIAELPPEARSVFSSADADGDGAVSAAEMLGLMMTAESGGARENGEGRVAPSPGTGSDGGSPQVGSPLMAALDADQDGTVSETEIETAAQSLRRLDTDSDGRISADELRPASSSNSSGGDPPE